MRRFIFFIAALAIGAAAVSSTESATAGDRHHKTKVALPTGERIRNAHAYSAENFSSAPDVRYFDEALSPPAGH